MATKEDDFKQRFVTVLTDLEQNGKDDPEALWLIGSLACSIIDKTGDKSWTSFKRNVSPQNYDLLLADFQKEGNRQHREGDRKKAYAIQVLAVSLIASTQKSREMQAGEPLLDRMIESTIRVYRQTQPKPN